MLRWVLDLEWKQDINNVARSIASTNSRDTCWENCTSNSVGALFCLLGLRRRRYPMLFFFFFWWCVCIVCLICTDCLLCGFNGCGARGRIIIGQNYITPFWETAITSRNRPKPYNSLAFADHYLLPLYRWAIDFISWLPAPSMSCDSTYRCKSTKAW